MRSLHAYALSGAIIASVATWGFLQFPGLLIWGAFISWAAFLHSGGTRDKIPTTLLCLLFGVIMAWVFALCLASGLLIFPVPIVAASLVAILAPCMIWASKLPLLSVVPATFYGFAASFAYLAQTPGKFTLETITSISLENVLIVVPASVCIGVGLGYLQTIFAASLIASSRPEADAA
ncbi:DUF1097 domain-containing protein [Pseudomonas sp. C32]|jgi:hypothetical protein|uniref:DUF1097 domain-containing protein n=1 Tax=Pseudomonas sp. C32 TaxID=1529208 RepID=UPI000FBB777C|nr:DUF1097 domain-containing protein [Pseudomonas sp. C32]MDN4546990.1 DUF1097 domain-containing protein [Pseudomonas sp. C32]